MNKILILFFVVLAFTEKCSHPAPAQKFTDQRYSGQWYEIGKYQTAGGAFFERDCTCTEMLIQKITGTLYAYQSCVKNGKTVAVNATLLPSELPGQFIEKMQFNQAAYYVIYLDDDHAIQYDCQQSLGVVNYCVHIMSRKTTMDSNKLEELKKYALGLGLNPRDLPFHFTEQQTCRKTQYLRVQ